jgi:hypothetical protein
MATAELTQRKVIPQHARRTLAAATYTYIALWLLTALTALAALVDPSLAPARAPHPALEPTLAAAGSILANNTRVLAPAMLLALCGFGASRPARTFADLLVAAPLALVTIQVGLALGRWGARLLPYIPQLPIEYVAAALAAGVWITYRHSPRPAVRALARDTGLMLALLAIAATVEVLATPHGP